MNTNTNEDMHRLLYCTPRIYWSTETHQCNYLHGLYKLIEDNLTSDMVMVEVGSCAAVSSHLFANKVKHIYCVDLWKAYSEIDEGHIKECERLFNNFLKRYTNVTKIKKSSVEASRDYGDHTLNFVYIDANHAYESVTEDITTWLPKIKLNGMIAGHDYHHSSVKKAVSEIFTDATPTIYEDFSWLIKL